MGDDEKEREESVPCIFQEGVLGFGIAIRKWYTYSKVVPFENGIDSCYVSLQCLSSLPCHFMYTHAARVR
jgi:hypothetical protein